MYGIGATSGLHVHIGRNATTIQVVWESQVRGEGGVQVDVGTEDCVEYLKGNLLSDPGVRTRLEELGGKEELARELAEVVLLGDQQGKGGISVPLANGQRVMMNNEAEGDNEGEEGVFNVAKESVSLFPPFIT